MWCCLTPEICRETLFLWERTVSLLTLTTPPGAPVSNSLPPWGQPWWTLYFPGLTLISHFHWRFLTPVETEDKQKSKALPGLFSFEALHFKVKQPGMILHTFNLEDGGSLWGWGHPRLYTVTFCVQKWEKEIPHSYPGRFNIYLFFS